MKKGKQLLAMALSAALTISGLPAVVLAEGQTSEMTGGGYKCTHEQAVNSGYPCEICKASGDILIQETDGEVVYLSEDKEVKTITGWIFPDDGNLSGGELALPGVNADNQADFDTVISMLPTGISAEIEGGTEPVLVDITGWSCPEYMQDDSGNWPVVGEYTFTAELPEGYVCDTFPLVKVVIGGAQVYSTIAGDGYSFDTVSGKLIVKSNAGTTDWRNNQEIKDAHGNYSAVKTLEITVGVREIGEDAFMGCTSLESVSIPPGVSEIGVRAFMGCTGLESVTISQGVETIRWNAFMGCSSLKSVTIPESVTAIGTNAFNGCTSLESVTLSEGIVAEIGESAFMGCSSLKSVTIPESVTAIGANAFKECTSLESVIIPKSVGGIGNSAFYGCTKLKDVIILEGVKKIEMNAFQACQSLERVTIPSSMENIGSGAFYGCWALKTMVINRTAAPSLGENALGNTPYYLVIHVPDNATGYDVENWPTDKVMQGAALTGLEISNGTLDPEFSPKTNTYMVSVPNEIESVTVTPTTYGADGTSVNGRTVASGGKSGSINLKVGASTIITVIVQVSSSSLDKQTYTITVTRAAAVINEKAIQGVTAPVRNAIPVTSITETEQYTGTVSWLPAVPSGGKFAANTEYTATITLSPKDGYTLEGVKKDFFTVAGAAATNGADSGVITAVFPKTAPIPHSHSYGDWKSDGTDHWRQCSCGSISDKASHDFSEWTVDQKPDEDGKVSSSRECTVCGYKQTEKNVPQTLTDPEAGVTVKGDFTSGAAISVKEAVLHEEGTCKVCDEIRARQKAGELIVLYDISLISGINSGEMEISIPVDEKYNGQTVILLHCMDKVEERLEVKVENGLATFTTKSLSPFAVLDTKRAESIKLTPSSLALEIGKSRQLTYTVTPEDIHSDEVIWTTSNKKVATVSSSGKVQAVKAGTATITCTAADGGGAKATCKVTVKNTATPLLNLRGTAGKNSIRLNWNQISNADGYEIYGSRCGSRYSYGKVKTVTKGSTKTWTQKRLRAGTAYKYYIKAYKLVNGKKLYLKTSLTSHVTTTGGRYTNTKTVTTTFTDLTLTKGKNRQISARITPVKKGGKLANHVPEFRYKTTNSKVAAVNDSGKITAAGKGKCSVYVYANNGVTRRILITVK